MKTECNVFSPSNYELSCIKHSCTSVLKYRLKLSSGWIPTRNFSLFSDIVKYLITELQEFLFSNILANTRYSYSLILTHDCLFMCLAVILSFPFAICVFTSLPIVVNLTQFILLQKELKKKLCVGMVPAYMYICEPHTCSDFRNQKMVSDPLGWNHR